MAAFPWTLVILRLLLAPTIVVTARAGLSGRLLAAITLIALFSDIYDGVLARRLHCDTPAIRLSDSLVDTVFYLGVLWALWIRVPVALLRFLPLLTVLLGLEFARHIYDLHKFGKSSSYHSYLAKAWGLVMAFSVMIVFIWNGAGMLLAISIVFGILANIEGLTMSVILPVWRNDVKTIGSALKIRKQAVLNPMT